MDLGLEKVVQVTCYLKLQETNRTDSLSPFGLDQSSAAPVSSTSSSDFFDDVDFTNDYVDDDYTYYTTASLPSGSLQNDNTSLVQNQVSTTHVDIEAILLSRVVPLLCAVGLVGNIGTLGLLASHGLRRRLGRMEKFAASGLAMLAATDAMFCLSVQPMAFFISPTKNGGRASLFSSSTDFWLLYGVYHNAVINTLIAVSSWLTVTLAIVRYIAVCHPLWARFFFGPTVAARFYIIVVVVSVLLNIPRYFIYRVETISCPDIQFVGYLRFYGWLRYHPTVELVYWVVYAVFGAILPFTLLAFANVNLIRALRHAAVARAAAMASPPTVPIQTLSSSSSRRGRGCSVASVGQQTATNHGEVGRYVTMTLVVVVALYLMLVAPAEVLKVVRELFPAVSAARKQDFTYNLCVAIVNTLQAANFSLNFIIYCVINVHFRRKLCCLVQVLFCCKWSQYRQPTDTYATSIVSHSQCQMAPLNTASSSIRRPTTICKLQPDCDVITVTSHGRR